MTTDGSFPKLGLPIIDPKYNSPCYRDPKHVALILVHPPASFSFACVSSLLITRRLQGHFSQGFGEGLQPYPPNPEPQTLNPKPRPDRSE